MDELIGLIPAAGKGVRLGLPYPKELYPVIRNNHYKPISQFVVDNLTNAGLKHIVFVVNEQGRVEGPRVWKSDNPMFDKSALDAVKKWRFEPGQRGGKPVRFRFRVPIAFPT